MQPDQPNFRTRSGIPLTIRPIEAADREALHRAFLRLSGESRYRRFLGPIADLEPAMPMLDVFRALPGATCAVAEPLAGVVEVRLALGPADEDLAKVIRVGSGAFAGAHHPDLPE